MNYLNFDEFRLEIMKIASQGDFEANERLLTQLPFKAYCKFKELLLKGYTIKEAFNAAIVHSYL